MISSSKKLFSFLFIFFVSIILTFSSGCALFKEDNSYKDIVELPIHMKKCGLDVQAVAPLDTTTVKATKGIAIKIGKNNNGVGVYKFNPDIKKQKEKLDFIKKNGFIYIMAVKYAAIENGPFVMIWHDRHPQKGKIIKAFKSF